ncbi:MAG: glycosyltransferase family 2 protein [Nitriliruptoraceae bacterium]
MIAGGETAALPPLPDHPVVSVVIPARNAGHTLPRAVEAALAQDPKPAEVVVAVGPSEDDTAEVAAALATEHPGVVRIVENPTGRTPDGLNAAIEAAAGEVIARVDTHAILPPGYLATAVAALRETGAGNVGGIQRPAADDGLARAVAAAMRSPAGTGGAQYRSGSTAGPVDTVYLGVFRREALEAVGGFDPAFTRNQDAELNLRLARAGYLVWLEPSLVVAYHPRGTLSGLARQYHGYGRWRRHTARVHPGSLRPRQLAAPAVVLAVVGAGLLSAVVRDARPVAIVGGGYLVGVVAAGVHAAEDLRDAPATACALAIMHASWGVGFLQGPPSDEVER